jgi:radical SAM superfamily enzyme YgiQ (UPF0313 family)
VRVLLVSANREKLPSPVVPLGLLYVAGAIRGAHDVELVDVCFADDPLATAAEATRAYRPDVVGLGLRNLHGNEYTSSEPLLAYYEALAKSIRASTDAPLVLGGPAVTLRPQYLLERLGAAHAVVGEGEHAFAAILDALARGDKPERVVYAPAAARGLAQLGKKALLGPRRTELDALPPPARDLIDPAYFAVEGTDSVQTKRGCAFHCTYCDYPDLEGHEVRIRDPRAVADEMVQRGQAPGVTHLFVVDSVFNVPRSHALAICDELVERGSPIPWVCYASPASLDDDVVAAMARAGCVGVEIGADSGTPRVLERLKKPFDLDAVRRVRASCARHGVADAHSFVLGAEGETVEEARGTLAFIDELDPDVATFVVFLEDREERGVSRAQNRDELLALLTEEAPKRQGWVVPELGIRFSEKLARIVRRRGSGPSWLHLAQSRRGR